MFPILTLAQAGLFAGMAGFMIVVWVLVLLASIFWIIGSNGGKAPEWTKPSADDSAETINRNWKRFKHSRQSWNKLLEMAVEMDYAAMEAYLDGKEPAKPTYRTYALPANTGSRQAAPRNRISQAHQGTDRSRSSTGRSFGGSRRST